MPVDSEAIEIVANMIMNVAAFIIILILALSVAKNRNKITENKLLFSLCVFILILACINIVSGIIDVNIFVLNKRREISYIIMFLCKWLSRLLILVIVVQWLLFVEFSLHQSRDVIRRRYPALLIPFVIVIILSIVNFGMDTYSRFYKVTSMLWFDIGTIIDLLGTGVLLFYFVLVFRIVSREKKRKPMPRLVAIKPMAGLALIGYIIMFLFGYSCMTICFAFGMIFQSKSLKRLLRKEDSETGFYNLGYLDTIKDYYIGHNIEGGTVIRFKTDDDGKKLSEILHNMEPDDSKMITMGHGTFLVISETQPESIIKWYTSLVLNEAENADIEVKSDYHNRTNESVEEFFTQFTC